MTRGKVPAAWKLVALAAFTSVAALASPAAAAEPSSTAAQASPSAATVGQAVTLSATVTCTADPSGGLGVTFFDGPDLVATVPVSTSGAAALTTSFSTVGTHTITAAYNGDDNCSASNDETTVTVSQTPVTPTQPSGLCLLACSSLFGFDVGDIHNQIVIHPQR